MKSFALLRTNVGLTTNVKIIIDSEYNLSLDSIDSDYELSSDRFKKFKFSKNNFYDELIPLFYQNVPSEMAFSIKYDNDVDLMSDDFSKQYDEIYNYGARNIIDNKNYSEEYEYFAPIYINPISLPSNFIIFRVDGTGSEIIDRNNYKNKILSNFKTVKIFNLDIENNLGQWLDKNYTSNKYFPYTPLEIDFKKLEFSKWNGIDYKTGGYTTKSQFLDNVFEEEKEIYELEKFIFNGYKDNKVVFPNILNLSFLFNDEPSTPEVKRKWSLNRYYGFYLNGMELIKTMSPYIPPTLHTDVVILTDNVLYSASSPTNPFLKKWTEDVPFYVEYNGEYYLVKKYIDRISSEIVNVEYSDFINEEYKNVEYSKYKIISENDLSGEEALLNKNYGFITEDDILMSDETTLFNIEDFEDADVWLIEIDGIYHNLIKNSSNEIKVITDYSFVFNDNTYEYMVGGKTTIVSFIVDYNNIPKKFNIYRLNFTDIKDFDTKIVDTEYSKYEYEKTDSLTDTDETKMYFENILSNSEPKELDDFVFNNKVVNIPVSSEYTANFETFKIVDSELSDIWRINPIYCRWGFQNSLSSNDYPYLLNNSMIFEEFNRTVDPFEANPIRSSRNLDYFYTINSSTHSYLHHTLHVEKLNNGQIDTDFIFDIDKYLNTTYKYDYFTYFFERKMEFDSSKVKKNVRKYSHFNKGDVSIPNITLFRGLEFKLYNVDSVKLKESGQIEKINVSNINEFEDYKFSIILTDNSDKCDFINLNAITTCRGTSPEAIWNEAYLDFKQFIEESCAITNCTFSESWSADIYVDGYPVYEGNVFYNGYVEPERSIIVSEVVDGFVNIGLTVSNEGENMIIRQIAEPMTQAPFIGLSLDINICLDFIYVCSECELSGTYSYCVNVCTTDFETEYDTIEIGSNTWRYINKWELFRQYNLNDLVIFDDIIYLCNSTTTETKPYFNIGTTRVRSAPYTSTNWSFFNNYIFWNPDKSYINSDIIYNNNRYYYCYDYNSIVDIWNPKTATTIGYVIDEVVLYKGKYYKSLIKDNYYTPGASIKKTKLREFEIIGNNKYDYWEPINEPATSKWKLITIWDPSVIYNIGQFVYHNDIVYISTGLVEIGDEPGVSISWEISYSFNPEITLEIPELYNNNSIIKMNNIFYLANG